MKKLLFFIVAMFATRAYTQPALSVAALPTDATLHFISPEPIQYVDISTSAVEGDLPLPNICRIHRRDSVSVFKGGVVTIAGETFLAQFRLVDGEQSGVPLIDIQPEAMRPLDIAAIGLTTNQLKALSLSLFVKKAHRPEARSKAFGIKAVAGVYTLSDYIFVDIGFKNETDLKYNIEDVRWTVEDDRITKATNVQCLELKPVFTLIPFNSFNKIYRNVLVFKKIAIPGNKVLRMTMNEKQVSGRVITLDITYRDILNADILP